MRWAVVFKTQQDLCSTCIATIHDYPFNGTSLFSTETANWTTKLIPLFTTPNATFCTTATKRSTQIILTCANLDRTYRWLTRVSSAKRESSIKRRGLGLPGVGEATPSRELVHPRDCSNCSIDKGLANYFSIYILGSNFVPSSVSILRFTIWRLLQRLKKKMTSRLARQGNCFKKWSQLRHRKHFPKNI